MKEIFERLLPWYRENRRALPFRVGRDPYRIWLSEIMLQQTRIEAVIPYYARFIGALPTVKDLAACEDEKLMKLWEGLGYYSRARNLKKAARIVVDQYGGEMPGDYEALLALPGIGAYTAGAIASIAFGLPCPAVDGNVLRVIARITGDERDVLDGKTREDVRAKLAADYPAGTDAGDLTEALMELGEVVCLPGTPKCEACPVKSLCRSNENGSWDRIPYRAKAKEKKLCPKTVFLLECGERVAVRQRREQGLLHGMFEFPNTDGHLTKAKAKRFLEEQGLTVLALSPVKDRRHVFTHLIWEMKGYKVQVAGEAPGFLWKTPEELKEEIALPTAFKGFMKEIL